MVDTPIDMMDPRLAALLAQAQAGQSPAPAPSAPTQLKPAVSMTGAGGGLLQAAIANSAPAPEGNIIQKSPLLSGMNAAVANAPPVAEGTGSKPDASKLGGMIAAGAGLVPQNQDQKTNFAPIQARPQAGPGGGAPTGPQMDMGIMAARPTGRPGVNPLTARNAAFDASDQEMLSQLGMVRDAETQKAENIQGSKYGEAAAIETAKAEATRINDERLIARQRADASMTAMEAELQKKMSEIKDIDPDGWFNKRDTALNIMSVLGVAIGEAGQALSKRSGPSGAMQMMQMSVQNDIAAQQKNREMAFEKVAKGHAMAKDSYARQQYLDDARAKDEILAWKKADATVAGLQSRLAGDNAQQEAVGIRAGIQGKMEDLKKQMADRRYQFALSQMQGSGGGEAALQKKYGAYVDQNTKLREEAMAKGETPPAQMGWTEFRNRQQGRVAVGEQAQGGGSGSQMGQVIKDPSSVPAKQRDQLIPAGDGTYRLAANTATAKEATDKLAGINASASAVDRLLAQREANGGGTISSDTTQQMKGDAALAKYHVAQALGMGAVASHEAKDLFNFIPEDPNAYNLPGRADPTKALQNAKRILEAKRSEILTSYTNKGTQQGQQQSQAPALPPGVKPLVGK